MVAIPKAIREQVYKRASYHCEYCQAFQQIIVSLEIDHIIPVSLGGKTELDNLCASCDKCNNYKKNAIEAIDPHTNTVQRLFNPRSQQWEHHFQWSEDGLILIGLTPIGRATIERLKLNRTAIIESRRLWASVGWHPPK
jgi:hypothetical protein